jgi:membrane protein DedA with SNARE-associated domain
MFDRLTDLVSGAWWSYLVIFAVAYLDVIIPLVPSETLVVTAGVIASSGDLQLPLVIFLAGLGAFLGDNTVYLIGRHWGEPVKRRFFSSKTARHRLDWADHQLDERGGELIVVARFIPGGRTAVCLSAGGLGMTWRRFATYDAIAATIWASYAALLGYVGGKQFEEAPWKGLALALVIAFSIAGGVELVRWLMRRRKAAKAVEAAEAADVADAG